MRGKRFIQLGDTHIKDTLTGEEWYAPCETSLLKLLNEQQATIEEQNKEIEESSAFIIEQRKENKRLNEEIEQLKQSRDRFVDTVAKQVSLIIELRKENEQLRKQVAEYEMILRQHEFAEKEGFQ